MSEAAEFLEAFSAAAHDRGLEERGFEIVHFFDSDIVGRMIFGYLDDLNRDLVQKAGERDLATPAGRQLLVGALIGQDIGAPPIIRALPPHLHEIRAQVMAAKRRIGNAAARLRDVMGMLGIQSTLQRLLDDFRDGVDADTLLTHLLDSGPQIFYGIDLLRGDWRSRLGRVLELGIAEPSPFEVGSEVVEAASFRRLSRFTAARHGGPPAMASAAVRDAMALAMIADGVREARGSTEPRKIARFYTETKRLLQAWSHEEGFRQLLTYEAPAHTDDDPSVHGVFRGAYYYLIRALVPGLRYREDDPPPEGDSLLQMCSDLAKAAELLRTGGIDERDLFELTVGDRTLGQYMADVTDTSAYTEGWRKLMQGAPSGLPKETLRDLEEVINGDQHRTRELEASYGRHVDRLSHRTSEVAEFSDIYVQTHEAVARLRGSLRPTLGDYFAHFGLSRWGFPSAAPCEEMLHRLTDEVETIDRSSGDDRGVKADDTLRVPIEISYRLLGIAESPEQGFERLYEAIAILGFLWLLRAYEMVEAHARRLLLSLSLVMDGPCADVTDRERIGGALENMIAAAVVRKEIDEFLKTGRPRPDAATLRRRADELVTSLEPAGRRYESDPDVIAVSTSYILFHAWSAMNRRAMAWAGGAQRVRHPDLAERSFELAWQQLEVCEPESPSYPLLLNHCLYVGSLRAMWAPTPDLEERLVTTLRELIAYGSRREPTWSYRFDDTLGYYYYARACRVLETLTLDRGSTATGEERAQRDLNEARYWLDRLPSDTSDDEAIAHRSLVYELEAELERRALAR